jgi:hypothetical protein
LELSCLICTEAQQIEQKIELSDTFPPNNSLLQQQQTSLQIPFPLQDLSSTTRATFTMEVTESMEVATHDCLTCIIQESPSPIDWEFILLVYYS